MGVLILGFPFKFLILLSQAVRNLTHPAPDVNSQVDRKIRTTEAGAGSASRLPGVCNRDSQRRPDILGTALCFLFAKKIN